MESVYFEYLAHLNNPSFEVTEVKGCGHPDTIADTIADTASQAYSNYTLDKFGMILRHNFDKLCILGGQSQVQFGNGRLLSPIRLILNGRAVQKVNSIEIPTFEIMKDAAHRVLRQRLKYFNPETELRCYDFISTSSSPGAVGSNGPRNNWFNPSSTTNFPNDLHSNDTSSTVARWPPTPFEQAITSLSSQLNEMATRLPWLGTDTKIMGVKGPKFVKIRIALPQIAAETSSLEEYDARLKYIYDYSENYLKNKNIPISSLIINARDKYEIPELYLTVTGSSIESGDEGVVGRGNRFLGNISILQSSSMEGISGKNPINHIGKVYSWVSAIVAKKLHEVTGGTYEVCFTSSTGSPLKQPLAVIVRGSVDTDFLLVQNEVSNALNSIAHLTKTFAQIHKTNGIANAYIPPDWNKID